MREAFTLERSYVAATDWYSLKRELFSYTDNEHEAFVDARFAAIKEGFNRIRGRIPRR